MMKGGWDKGMKGGWGGDKMGKGKGDMWGAPMDGGMMGKGKGMMKGKGKGKMGLPEVDPMMMGMGERKPTNREKGPDPSKQTFNGQVVTQAANNGYIACDETMAAYGKDVYMWKTYFNQVGLGDWVKFQIHISDK